MSASNHHKEDLHQLSEKIWSKGDECQAVWSVDGNTYKSTVRGFRERSGRTEALVHYSGYESDGDEWQPVSALTPSPRRPPSSHRQQDVGAQQMMFSPLTGEEEKQRLEEKFRSLDYESDDDWSTSPSKDESIPGISPLKRKSPRKPTTSRGTTPRKRAKMQLEVSGGRTRNRPVSSTSRTSLGLQSTVSSSSDEDLVPDTPQHGFDDEDFIKPCFSHKGLSDRVPLVLDSSEPPVQVPATVNQYLYEYQRDGVRFLYAAYQRGQGALLADDMGLGKTVQVVAFLSAIMHKTATKADLLKQRLRFIRQMSSDSIDEEHTTKPCLVIGPASVLHTWLNELDTWGHFSARKYHTTDKAMTVTELKKNKLDVVVTTFETARDNIEELNRFTWGVVVADEAHKLKSTESNLTRVLKGLSCRIRIGLTGTPMQNSLEEYWCVFNWVRPGYLGTLADFTDRFISVIKRGQKHSVSKRHLAEARKAQEKLRELTAPLMLRRTKALIADQLPSKVERVVYCEPSPIQRDIYQSILADPLMKDVLSQRQPCPCGRERMRSKCCFKRASGGQSISALTFSFMHLLLKVANHVALLLTGTGAAVRGEGNKVGGAKSGEITEAVARRVMEEHTEFLSQTKLASYRTLSNPKYCGKMKVLEGLLSVFSKEKSRVLLFSHSTKLLDILETYVMTRGFQYRRLDGATGCSRRADIVTEFNTNSSIFLMLVSTKAGGVGLSLTGANVVIIFDPTWNPTHDLQAQDRAHRLGQHRDVRVYRLITAGLIEENIYLRQVYKQQLSHVAVSGENAVRYFEAVEGERSGELFGLENMFSMRNARKCLTADIMKRQCKIDAGLEAFDIERYIPRETPPTDTPTDTPTDDNHERAAGSDSADEDGYGAEHIYTQLVQSDDDDHHSPSHPTHTDQSQPGDSHSSQSEASRRQRGGSVSPQSYSSVSEVLGGSGVVHAHEHQALVGANSAENLMTHRALEDVFELHQNSQEPAALCPPTKAQVVKNKRSSPRKNKPSPLPTSMKMGSTRVLIGQTPKAVKRAEFACLASHHGFSSTADFARHVLSCSEHERQDLLKTYYFNKHPTLTPLYTDHPAPNTDDAKSDRRVRTLRKGKDSQLTKHAGNRTGYPTGTDVQHCVLGRGDDHSVTDVRQDESVMQSKEDSCVLEKEKQCTVLEEQQQTVPDKEVDFVFELHSVWDNKDKERNSVKDPVKEPSVVEGEMDREEECFASDIGGECEVSGQLRLPSDAAAMSLSEAEVRKAAIYSELDDIFLSPPKRRPKKAARHNPS